MPMSVVSRVRAFALLDFPAIALEAGIDPYAALSAAGIDAAMLDRPDLTIPADRVAWLLDSVAERSGVADLGIRIAMRRRLASLGVAGLVLVQQPTVRDVLSIAEKYHHLLTDSLSQHIVEADGTATLIVGIAIGSSAPGRQSRELGLAVYVHLFRLLLGESWSPLTVHFAHSAPQGRTLHRSFFGCPVQFDSSLNGFECNSVELDRINPSADAALAKYAGYLLDTLPGQQGGVTRSMVNRLIHALLPMGNATIGHVAKAMGRNVRTLQRELASEGNVFEALLADARATLAIEMLRDGSQPIEAIAERLGYSHPSAFIRFFKGRFGQTPGQWRFQGPVIEVHGDKACAAVDPAELA
jgi:AraC-like DNA-binding protein